MYKPALTAAVAASLIAACSGSSSDQSTMDLLKAGDAKICVAADVEETLRGLIIPKGKDAKGYNISFDTATLETFDKAVSKASCHVLMRITSETDVELVPSTGIDFTVVPSAQNPADFVVSAPVERFKQQLASAIDNDALHQEQDREREADASRLAALVKPGWLLGRWVASNQGSDTCMDGPYYDFARGGRLSFGEATGTWKLVSLDLTIIGPGAAFTGTVAEADATTFTSRNIKGDATSFRRCSREETTPVTDDDPNEPDTSGIDAENPTPPQP